MLPVATLICVSGRYADGSTQRSVLGLQFGLDRRTCGRFVSLFPPSFGCCTPLPTRESEHSPGLRIRCPQRPPRPLARWPFMVYAGILPARFSPPPKLRTYAYSRFAVARSHCFPLLLPFRLALPSWIFFSPKNVPHLTSSDAPWHQPPSVLMVP